MSYLQSPTQPQFNLNCGGSDKVIWFNQPSPESTHPHKLPSNSINRKQLFVHLIQKEHMKNIVFQNLFIVSKTNFSLISLLINIHC